VVEKDTLRQAGNQHGTPGGAKSFLRGVQIFQTSPIFLNYVQHILPGAAKKILGGFSPLGYGPALWSSLGINRDQCCPMVM